MIFDFDVIVVGGGHAGCEAAAAAANLGCEVLLITMDMTKFGQMSCNPAVGGIAKGQIVREIDALGGYMGIVTDRSSIQFKLLNRSKGPAMWSPRSQCDKDVFCKEWRTVLEKTRGLNFWQDSVISLIIDDSQIRGVVTRQGVQFHSKSVILTAGTFLNGLIHVGQVQSEGGRMSDQASYGLTEQLAAYGFTVGRMKTGTPVRIDSRTVEFSKMTEQAGEEGYYRFSYLPISNRVLEQKSCYITYTSEEVHQELRKGLHESPMYNGTIQSLGPRYCPSIETKIVNFADKDRHQLFLEPEGENTIEYYLNGFSSSLPLVHQLNAMSKIPGLEKARIFRPGYAIEYDFFDPTQLNHTLETKLIKGLFLAGQVNGTTGYEEAGAQGLMAGINAAFKIQGKEPFVLARDEAYIGVLIDDLITKGVDEPYRMFTSRAEYRILLRQDNADDRLTEKGYQVGLVSQERLDIYRQKCHYRQMVLDYIENKKVKPEAIDPLLLEKGSQGLAFTQKLKNILLRPQVNLRDFVDYFPDFGMLVEAIPEFQRDEILDSVEIVVKYEGYIGREQLLADKFKRLENLTIKDRFSYSEILSLSTEARQKLAKINPETLGQAQRIPGVSPSDINVLLVLMGR
ncbi:MAG: tRNA uridine-5-carboxymethylaminomethyl(34) synthesis enzyme MnmG [Chitinophagales bacterium]|nr:tRNA uridine-5-carboxymethylaminomethyl(34) synthesis enzyme MnmG [Chitinophagales bacterium]